MLITRIATCGRYDQFLRDLDGNEIFSAGDRVLCDSITSGLLPDAMTEPPHGPAG